MLIEAGGTQFSEDDQKAPVWLAEGQIEMKGDLMRYRDELEKALENAFDIINELI